MTDDLDLVGQLPFRYTDEEAMELSKDIQTLMATPEWTAFTKVLDSMIHGAREQGFADVEKIVRWKGFVEGIEAVYQMALWFPTKAKEIVKRDEAMAERAAKRRKGGYPDETSRLTI